MEIEIADYDLIYKQLDLPRVDIRNPNYSELVDDISENVFLEKTDGFLPSSYIIGSVAQLPWPFKFAKFLARREGDSFYAGVAFGVRGDCHFEGFSDFLHREINNWLTISSNGTGYFVDNSNRAIVSVDRAVLENSQEDEDLLRIISIGGNGTMHRSFKEGDEFHSHINNLQDAVNKYCRVYSSWTSHLNCRKPSGDGLIVSLSVV